MAVQLELSIRSTSVTVEFTHHRYLGWQVGSWWTDNERVTDADVQLAADDVIAERSAGWDIDERRYAKGY